jgi:hypothetical protein
MEKQLHSLKKTQQLLLFWNKELLWIEYCAVHYTEQGSNYERSDLRFEA